MYCPKCGTENSDDAQLCTSCHWVLASVSITGKNPNAKTSGLAITALILAVLSFFTFFLTMLPAVIFGIVSLVKIERSGGQLKGRGLAITGIVAPVILLPVIALLMGMMMPALARVRMIAKRITCATNISQLGKMMCVYANDHEDNYPDTSQWCDLLTEYTDANSFLFRCQGTSEGPCNYAMNENIENLGLKVPPDMVLLFETSPGWNQIGGPGILTTENHNGYGCNVLFNDLHVEFVKTEGLHALRWTAEQKE